MDIRRKRMKRIIISVFCILSLSFFTSCKKIEPPLGNSDNNTANNQISNNADLKTDSNSNVDNIAIAQEKSTDLSNNNVSQSNFNTNQSSKNNDNSSYTKNNNYVYTSSGIIESKFAENIIKPTSDAVIQALKNKDMEVVASYVHPTLGVRFSPYTYITADQDILFGPEKIKNFFQDKNKYQWGYYDGIGDKIELTPEQYYNQYIYSSDFVKADTIGYNTILAGGNTLNNLYEIYQNAIAVEYYFHGFDPQYDGIDWQSLCLVFQEYNGTWYLVGIIHNSMTV